MLFTFLLAALAAFGFSVAVVEKGKRFPVNILRVNLYIFLKGINPKLTPMLNCSVCLSFWAGTIFGFISCLFSGEQYWFLHLFASPLAGFTALGFTWFVYELLSVLEKETSINIHNETKDQVDEPH